MPRVELAEIRERKFAVRERQKLFLATLTPEQKAGGAAAAAALLLQQRAWKSARAVLLYSALKSEIDLRLVIEAAFAVGKTVALPQWSPATETYLAAELRPADARLVKGSFGVLEPPSHALPIPWNRLDFALVPGVAFDLRGVRLGRGKGFYDRMLAEVEGPKCGICFDPQVVRELPFEAHDIRMNCLLTPTRWIEFPREGT